MLVQIFVWFPYLFGALAQEGTSTPQVIKMIANIWFIFGGFKGKGSKAKNLEMKCVGLVTGSCKHQHKRNQPHSLNKANFQRSTSHLARSKYLCERRQPASHAPRWLPENLAHIGLYAAYSPIQSARRNLETWPSFHCGPFLGLRVSTGGPKGILFCMQMILLCRFLTFSWKTTECCNPCF